MIAALLIGSSLKSCKVSDYQSDAHPVSHEIWNALVQKYAHQNGKVNYAGFIQ